MSQTPQTVLNSERRVGTLLKGKWHIDAILGVGGMATVYAATHRNKKRVAIKMLHPEVSLNRDVSSRFLREGYVANTVEHPGTVAVLDDDVTEDGAAFLVMELLVGETVDARQERKGGKLTTSETLWVAERLLDVLAAAHDKGIVHRDIKPENLFITTDQQFKVLDFGIARMHEASTGAGATLGTQVGSLMGTPGFMSPEQARGRTEQIDARTDLWAVGATMFRVLTGRPVHEAVTLNEQLIFAATIPAPSIGELAPWLPPALIALVDRALAFDKNDRWPSAAAMLEALRLTLKDDSGAPAMSVSLPPPQVAALHEAVPSSKLHYQGGTLPLSEAPSFDLADSSQPPPEAAPEPSQPPSLPPVSATTQSSATSLQASGAPPSLSPATTATSSIPPTSELPPLAQPEAPVHRRRAVFVAIAAVASAATLGLVLLSRAPQATQDAEATSKPRPSATQHETSAPGADPPATVKSAAPAEPTTTQAPTAASAASAASAPTAEGGPGKDPRAPASQGKEPRDPPKKPATPAATTTGTAKAPPPATTTAAAPTAPPTAAPPTAAPTAAPPTTATTKPGANPFDRRF